MKRIYSLIIVLSFIFGLTVSAHAALIDRGGGLIYDTDLDIIWFQEPNNTPMLWDQAMTWAIGPDRRRVDRLAAPPAVDGPPNLSCNNGTTSVGYNITTSEMGHLFYTELGNKGLYGVDGLPQEYGLVNNGPFTNLQPAAYWSGTAVGVAPVYAWVFDFRLGAQVATSKGGGQLYALAVHSGDVYARWAGSMSSHIKFTSVIEKSSGGSIFQEFSDDFTGTMEFYKSKEGPLKLKKSPDGCYVKFWSDDGAMTLCIKEVAFLSADVRKSTDDKLILKGTGDFSIRLNETNYSGGVYLDAQGISDKDASGGDVSIRLKGEIGGGSNTSVLVFEGDFQSTLTKSPLP